MVKISPETSPEPGFEAYLCLAIHRSPFPGRFRYLLHGVDHDEAVDAVAGADPEVALLSSPLGRLDDGDAVEAAALDLRIVHGCGRRHHRHRLDEERYSGDGSLLALRFIPGR